jgi:hypothetical protein
MVLSEAATPWAVSVAPTVLRKNPRAVRDHESARGGRLVPQPKPDDVTVGEEQTMDRSKFVGSLVAATIFAFGCQQEPRQMAASTPAPQRPAGESVKLTAAEVAALGSAGLTATSDGDGRYYLDVRSLDCVSVVQDADSSALAPHQAPSAPVVYIATW